MIRKQLKHPSSHDLINSMTYDQEFRDIAESRIGLIQTVTIRPSLNQIILTGSDNKITLPLKETVKRLESGENPGEIIS